MDFLEKTKVRIRTWMEHNHHHQEEYELFADQLEKEGNKESALHIRHMAVLTAKINDALHLALESLERDNQTSP